MLALVAFDPHLVEQMNDLIDETRDVSAGFLRGARAHVAEKWQRRLDQRVIDLRGQAIREALSVWVYTEHPEESIDRASGRVVHLVLESSGGSAKAARRALEALADLEGAWHAWAGLPDPTNRGLGGQEGAEAT